MSSESTVKIFQEVSLETGEILKENRFYNFENSYVAFNKLAEYICYLSDKDPSSIRVLMLLINEASKENIVSITQEEIANKLNKSLSLIKKCMKSLIKDNAIKLVPSLNDSRKNIVVINGSLVWKGKYKDLVNHSFTDCLVYQSIIS